MNARAENGSRTPSAVAVGTPVRVRVVGEDVGVPVFRVRTPEGAYR
ncbi:hypothetical protein ACH4S8_07930 [Streptomyces sp. NPDC021080]